MQKRKVRIIMYNLIALSIVNSILTATGEIDSCNVTYFVVNFLDVSLDKTCCYTSSEANLDRSPFLYELRRYDDKDTMREEERSKV